MIAGPPSGVDDDHGVGASGGVRPPAVVVVDHHPVALVGTATLLAERGVEILGLLDDPATLERLLAEAVARPGGRVRRAEVRDLVVLLDPGGEVRAAALAAIAGCQRQFAHLPILAFTSDVSPATVEALLDAGCSGVVPKTASADQLVDAIVQLTLGERHLHPRALAALLHRRQVSETVRSMRPLSVRELAVLKEVAEGRSNAEIAEQLGVSEATVKTHLAHLLRKLHAQDRAHAVSRGLRLGLFD